MLIVCTRDQDIVNWTRNVRSGSAAWGQIFIIPRHQDQAAASTSLAQFISGLDENEPLCFSSHGNDTEIGDAEAGNANWGWSYQDIANMLAEHAPEEYKGPILIHACAERVSNFAARLALALQDHKPDGALDGVWIFGYNLPIDATTYYPAPDQLFKQVDLQWTQVRVQPT